MDKVTAYAVKHELLAGEKSRAEYDMRIAHRTRTCSDLSSKEDGPSVVWYKDRVGRDSPDDADAIHSFGISDGNRHLYKFGNNNDDISADRDLETLDSLTIYKRNSEVGPTTNEDDNSSALLGSDNVCEWGSREGSPPPPVFDRDSAEDWIPIGADRPPRR